MAEDAQDLESFLSERPEYRPACGTCELPKELLAQMDAVVSTLRAQRKKPPWTGMSEWLRKQGVTHSAERIKRHYDRGHHER